MASSFFFFFFFFFPIRSSRAVRRDWCTLLSKANWLIDGFSISQEIGELYSLDAPAIFLISAKRLCLLGTHKYRLYLKVFPVFLLLLLPICSFASFVHVSNDDDDDDDDDAADVANNNKIRGSHYKKIFL